MTEVQYKIKLPNFINLRKDFLMKKTLLTLLLGLMAVTAAHAQQTVVIQRPGILTDLATALVGVPATAVTGIVVGTVEAAGSLIHGSTEIIVMPPATPVSPPMVVTPAPVMATPPAAVTLAPAAIPSTTIITTHGDGSVTTVTRQASAYELGPVILTPVDPTHRVGPSPHVNPYVYRHR